MQVGVFTALDGLRHRLQAHALEVAVTHYLCCPVNPCGYTSKLDPLLPLLRRDVMRLSRSDDLEE